MTDEKWLTLLQIDSPDGLRVPDLMLRYQSMVEAGVISRKELHRSLKLQRAETVQLHQELFTNELERIEGLLIHGWLSESLVWVFIDESSIASLEDASYVRQVALSERLMGDQT